MANKDHIDGFYKCPFCSGDFLAGNKRELEVHLEESLDKDKVHTTKEYTMTYAIFTDDLEFWDPEADPRGEDVPELKISVQTIKLIVRTLIKEWYCRKHDECDQPFNSRKAVIEHLRDTASPELNVVPEGKKKYAYLMEIKEKVDPLYTEQYAFSSMDKAVVYMENKGASGEMNGKEFAKFEDEENEYTVKKLLIH